MSDRKIIISTSDHRRLNDLLGNAFAAAIEPRSYLTALRAELQRAEVVRSEEMPADVVTMNSKVRLFHLHDNESDDYTLVYPELADISSNKLSVLAPIGTAILGYRIGDVITWQVPAGARELMIEELLYQPEREGALHL
ncbi:MAG: nucleoside diphosphate kinase regulator [Fuerstiella sp.]